MVPDFHQKQYFEWISSREIKVYDFNMRARGLHSNEIVVRWYDLRSGTGRDLRENPGRRRESTLYFSRSSSQPLAFQLYIRFSKEDRNHPVYSGIA
jgi:hypothetical protein